MKTAKQKRPKMEVEFLKNLPSEIVIEILSRLPIRTIKICRRVRKSWRDLIQTREFADHHLSKSTVQGLASCQEFEHFEILAFEDEELDLEDRDRRYKRSTSFSCSELGISICDLKGSVNGLLFLNPLSSISSDYYICNPVTREYIELPYEQRLLDVDFNGIVNYGFGVSKVSHQYKVVKIVHVRKSICHVYTIGTGKWKKIASCPRLARNDYSTGAFINGCVHWFVEDYNSYHLICCFDLETETFSTFSHPPLPMWKSLLVALGDHLCICDNSNEDEIAFWVMKEYGNEESWRKEFVIRKTWQLFSCGPPPGIVYPIKAFKDGHVLMTWQRDRSWFYDMYYYSNKTKTTEEFNAYQVLGISGASPMNAMVYKPSFLSLKCFPKEYVTSFRRSW